jgi:large subunit ribosomal protein L10
LTGNSAIFISDVANAPGKIIKDFRKKSAKPVLKGAYINSEIYIGDDQLDALATIKSKEELLGELIGLLQSPAQRIISALQNKFAGSEEEVEA